MGDQNFEKCFLLLTFLFIFKKQQKKGWEKKGKMCFLLGTFWYILAYFWLFLPHFLKMWQNVWLFFIDKCALSPICTSAHLFIAYFSKEQKSVMCDVWMGNCPTLSREKKGKGGKKKKFKKMIVLKTQFYKIGEVCW